MIQQSSAPILRNEKLAAPGHHILTFHAPALARDARPGSFVAVHAPAIGGGILRRPFSVYTADPETGVCSILFSVYGASTAAMATYKEGDRLDILGPLGGSVFRADARPGARHICVGGGYGVPPLTFLTRQILATDSAATVLFISGARTKDYLVGTDGLDNIGATLLPATDDGSHGFHGRVTGVLERCLSDKERPTTVYTCGPTPMMRAVAEMATAHETPCQVSLEVFMPCGVGICMGCAVPTPDGKYVRGCVEGPVFGAGDILWK